MEFGVEKCTMLRMKSGKQHMIEGRELLNQKKIRMLREETFKYLGILEADTIKEVEMKEKIKKSFSGEQESYSKQNYTSGTYKTRHDWMGKVIHWELCKKLKFDPANKWYMQESLLENEMHKLHRDFVIQIT